MASKKTAMRKVEVKPETVTAKYNLGDTVWIMEHNKPKYFTVGSIRLASRGFWYSAEDDTVNRVVYNHQDVVFPTKEALIASL